MTLAKDIEPSASSSLPLVLMDIIDVDIYDLKIAFVNHFFQITNLIFKQIVLIRGSQGTNNYAPCGGNQRGGY